MSRASYAKPSGTLAVHATKLALFKTLLVDTLEAGGIIKTADANQINWGTVNLALDNASPVTYGFEIRRMSDTLQGTHPIFFKIIFRNDTNGNGDAKFNLAAGTGSDGSGNLTGEFMTGLDFIIKNSGSIRNCFVNCETGNLMCWTYNNRSDTTTNEIMMGGIERTRDQDGEPTSDGLLVYRAYNTQTSIGGSRRDFFTYRRGVGLVGTGGADTATASNRGGTSAPPDNVSTGIQTVGNEISVYRAPFYDGSKILHPMKSFISAFANDYVFEAIPSVTLDGVAADYLGLQKVPWLCRGNVPSTMGTLMRYVA
jgi:hypothetical protein